MDETFSTKAIILNKQAFRENDTRVSVFCLERGRLELVARGARKISSKLAGHIEPITLSNIMIVRGKRFNYLGSAINEDSFLNIKDDFNKLTLAGKGINIFKKLIKENEEDEQLFGLLNNFLDTLNNHKLPITNPVKDPRVQLDFSDYELFYNFFVLKLISELGYKPELHNCLVCKKRIVPGGNRFDFHKGGVLHNNCVEADNRNVLTTTDNCIKVLRMVIQNDLNETIKLVIDNKLEREIKKIIGSFYKYNF